MLGLLIAVAGTAIFIVACIHFLKGRGNLVTTGLYSMVRHPQYLGMMIAALGASMIFMAVAGDLLLVVVGYVLLAELEERHLLKEYQETYLRYKRKTPFMFPIPCPPKLNEFLFSLALTVLLFIALYLSGSLTTKVW